MIKVFLDANVYFAGFFSKGGASAFVIELANRNKFQVIATRLVLREADRNLKKKSDQKTLKAFHHFLQKTKIKVAPSPAEQSLREFEAFVHPKDVPVIATAFEAKVDYLLTLDKQHLLKPEVLSHIKKFKILTPGDFLQQTYF